MQRTVLAALGQGGLVSQVRRPAQELLRQGRDHKVGALPAPPGRLPSQRPPLRHLRTGGSSKSGAVNSWAGHGRRPGHGM